MTSLNKVMYIYKESVLKVSMNPLKVPRIGEVVFLNGDTFQVLNVVWDLDDNKVIINIG